MRSAGLLSVVLSAAVFVAAFSATPPPNFGGSNSNVQVVMPNEQLTSYMGYAAPNSSFIVEVPVTACTMRLTSSLSPPKATPVHVCSYFTNSSLHVCSTRPAGPFPALFTTSVTPDVNDTLSDVSVSLQGEVGGRPFLGLAFTATNGSNMTSVCQPPASTAGMVAAKHAEQPAQPAQPAQAAAAAGDAPPRPLMMDVGAQSTLRGPLTMNISFGSHPNVTLGNTSFCLGSMAYQPFSGRVMACVYPSGLLTPSDKPLNCSSFETSSASYMSGDFPLFTPPTKAPLFYVSSITAELKPLDDGPLLVFGGAGVKADIATACG